MVATEHQTSGKRGLHPKCVSTPPRESAGASNGAYHQKFMLLFHNQQPVFDQYDWRFGVEGTAAPNAGPPTLSDWLSESGNL
jgi:hypothetical protein